MDIFSKVYIDTTVRLLKGYTQYGENVIINLSYLFLAIVFFIIPVLIAFLRKHKNVLAISITCAIPFIAVILMMLDIEGIASEKNATGYAFLVWAIALIWSVAKPLTIEIKSNESKNTKANKENKKTEE